MMKTYNYMKNKVYIVMIILIIFLFLLAIYSFLVGEGIIDGFFSPNEKSFFGRDDSSNKNEDSESGPSSGGSGTGAGIEGVGSTEKNEADEEGQKEARSLPSDLYTNDCGFYFAEYDVCAGVCPDGSSCGSDGRSCYCKKN